MSGNPTFITAIDMVKVKQYSSLC